MPVMKRFTGLTLIVLLGFSPAAFAHTWSAAQVENLERAALAAPDEGVPVPAAALEQVTLMQHVRAIDPVYQGSLDLAADDLFAQLAQAYARGAVDPNSVDREWRLAPPPPADIAALSAALQAGAAPSLLLQTCCRPRASIMRCALNWRARARTRWRSGPGAARANPRQSRTLALAAANVPGSPRRSAARAIRTLLPSRRGHGAAQTRGHCRSAPHTKPCVQRHHHIGDAQSRLDAAGQHPRQ
jgi:hypothetical protein